VLTAAVSAAAAAETWQEQIQAVLAEPKFKQAHWGLLVADVGTGEVLYAHNPEQLFAPASTTKLYSVAAALDEFGAEHRFETPIYAQGKIEEGTLRGELILVASGDPTMGGRTTPEGTIAFANTDHTYAIGNDDAQLTSPDPVAGLNQLAAQVAAAGVRKVEGDVLIDDRLFDRNESTGSGPTRLTPIMINDNVLDLTISPAQIGQPAKIEFRPQTGQFEIESQVETVAADGKFEISDIDWTNSRHLVVRGKIPAGRSSVVQIAEVPDPALAARGFLIEALRRAGIEVSADIAAAPAVENLPMRDAYPSLQRLALLTSPPFSEEAKLILKVSHNLHASTLPMLLAARHGKRQLDDGLALEYEFFKRAGVEADTISFGGGAGGSRADWITPQATVQLLRYMATREDFAHYRHALPVLGLDGTLAQSVAETSPARGKVQAKTGTFYWHNGLRNRPVLLSKALAGYITAQSGRELAFAFFVNNVHLEGSHERQAIGQTLGKLAEITQQGL
jgi:D-alanyl-D-alanine carboxypeptidase/D-alanyl-D-alanine-endopeptidase (penicillin-binding protein 4)